MAEQRGRHRLAQRGRTMETRVMRISILAASVILLFLVLVWLVDLEQRLPDVRAPREFSESNLLSGHAIMAPGYRDVDDVDAAQSGEWIEQEIGDSTWLATDTPGSRIQAAFYGTDLYLVARIGPEAGRAYIRVDGEPVSGLNEDETGTYSDLWAGEASDQSILIASGLAHGEHVVEVTSGGEGEVAISGFEVVSDTPFQWAFLLAYVGIGGGIFMALRDLLGTISMRNADPGGSEGSGQSDKDVPS